jgi:hypothetical protein
MKHPNVVSLREAFTTKAFNDNCTSTFHLPIYLFPPSWQRPYRNKYVANNSSNDGIRFPPKLDYSRGRTLEPRNDGHDPSSEITPAHPRTVIMELYHPDRKCHQSYSFIWNGIEGIRPQSDHPYGEEQVRPSSLSMSPSGC